MSEDEADEPDEAEIEADEAAPNEDAEAEEGLQRGDFVRLAYTVRTVEDGTLVDTTDEEVAEDEGVDTEEQTFEPRMIVIGSGHLFDGVEEALIGQSVGDSGEVTVDARDAFGEFDPDQVRTVSAEKIPEDQRFPGAHVDVDGQHGHVETVIGGRARVDFNHPLAGEDIEYAYEILGTVEDPIERAEGLLGAYIDLDLDLSIEPEEEERPTYDDEGEETGTETVELETLFIEATPQLAMNQQWLFSKQQIAQELIDKLGIDRVVVREVLDGTGGFGGLGGLGGVDLEEAVQSADLDEDIDADELIEELEDETDLEAEGAEVVEEE